MTAKIKLNAASGGGSFSLQAPSSSANNRVFTLPDSADATLLTSTASLGKFASYAIIADVKAHNTSGGAFTSGAWRTRDLNTEIADADGIVSISSNQFVLQSGTYYVTASAPALTVSKHKIKLYNISDSADVQLGTSSRTGSSDSTQTRSELSTRFTIGSAKTYEIQHQCETTQSGGWGMGSESDFGSDTELYTIVEIFKES